MPILPAASPPASPDPPPWGFPAAALPATPAPALAPFSDFISVQAGAKSSAIPAPSKTVGAQAFARAKQIAPRELDVTRAVVRRSVFMLPSTVRVSKGRLVRPRRDLSYL